MSNVKNVKLITNVDSLRSVLEDMVNHPVRWTLPVVDWQEIGLKVTGSGDTAAIVPNRGNTVVAAVGDYVITMQNNAKFVVFTPELKERIERKDFSWIATGD